MDFKILKEKRVIIIRRETRKERPSKMKKNNKNIENKELSKVEQLEKELEYLRAENAVLKKLREIRLKQSQTKKKQK